jgi:hypothetical protein
VGRSVSGDRICDESSTPAIFKSLSEPYSNHAPQTCRNLTTFNVFFEDFEKNRLLLSLDVNVNVAGERNLRIFAFGTCSFLAITQFNESTCSMNESESFISHFFTP